MVGSDRSLFIARSCWGGGGGSATIIPFCVFMLEDHGMAGTYVVVSGHRCQMFGRLGDRVMYLAPSTVAPGRATR